MLRVEGGAVPPACPGKHSSNMMDLSLTRGVLHRGRLLSSLYGHQGQPSPVAATTRRYSSAIGSSKQQKVTASGTAFCCRKSLTVPIAILVASSFGKR